MKKKTLKGKLAFEAKDLSLLNNTDANALAGGAIWTNVMTCPWSCHGGPCNHTEGSACQTACPPDQCW